MHCQCVLCVIHKYVVNIYVTQYHDIAVHTAIITNCWHCVHPYHYNSACRCIDLSVYILRLRIF